MANCPNCGAALSCGCQRKTASDGKQGCVQCIPAYEQRLKKQLKEGTGGKLPKGNGVTNSSLPKNNGTANRNGFSFDGGNLIMN